VLTAAERSGRVLPRGPKPIWVTEIDWDSNPPDPGGLRQQARNISLTFYLLWRQGVDHVFWLEPHDPEHAPAFLSGSGLFFANGRPKPSVSAYRFPFVAIPGAGRSLTLWGRAPAPGRVTIEIRRAGRWHTLLRLTTAASGVFYEALRRGAPGLLRARSGHLVSYPWSAR
jgi:hypothetical protein